MEDPLLKSLAMAAATAKPHGQELVPLIKKREGLFDVGMKGELQSILEPYLLRRMAGDADAGNRAWAASAVSVLACNDPVACKHLLASNVVGHLIGLLDDPNREVMVEALGTLRVANNPGSNLSALGDPGIVTELFNKKILVPLHKLMATCGEVISKLIQNVAPADDSEKDDYRVCFQVAENVVCILWSMGETSTKLLAQVSQDLAMNFILSCLHSAQHLPVTLVDVAARCLLTLTESNFELLSNFLMVHFEHLRVVESLVDSPASLMLQVLAVGILSNLRALISPAIERRAMKDTNYPRCFFSRLTSMTPSFLGPPPGWYRALRLLPPSTEGVTSEEDAQKLEPKSAAFQAAGALLSDQHVVLEILADLTSSERSEDAAQEDAKGFEDGMSDGGEDNSDVEIPAEIEPDEAAEIDSTALYTLDELFPKLRGLAGPHQLVLDQPTQSQHAILASGLTGLHHRSLSVLNNLLTELAATMSASQRRRCAEKYHAGTTELWGYLFSQVSVYSQLPSDDHREVVSQALSCLWSLARWAGYQALRITDEHLHFLLGLATSNDGVASVKAVGILGIIAQRRPGHVESNKVVGDFLMQIVGQLSSPTQPGPELVFAALNAIYDIYGDASHDYDVVFIGGGYLDTLEAAIPRLNKLVRGIDRRKDLDLREHGDETLINLRAFVKYKKLEYKAIRC
ncbi:hypothetical protein L0F63_005725 [Massospora cicadina]|nr:hypothetical protein L0F63_005725 [Massospora cicadina]